MVCPSQSFGVVVLVEIAGTVELQRELLFVEDYYGFGTCGPL